MEIPSSKTFCQFSGIFCYKNEFICLSIVHALFVIEDELVRSTFSNLALRGSNERLSFVGTSMFATIVSRKIKHRDKAKGLICVGAHAPDNNHDVSLMTIITRRRI